MLYTKECLLGYATWTAGLSPTYADYIAKWMSDYKIEITSKNVTWLKFHASPKRRH
jgi:hypothetical protein